MKSKIILILFIIIVLISCILIYKKYNSNTHQNEEKEVISDKDTIKNVDGINYINDIIIVNKTYSLKSTYAPNDLVLVNDKIYISNSIKEAFLNLVNDAKKNNLNIYASSGYRSYDYQKQVYNSWVKKDGVEEADTYSARPGHSEHQTGLAIDVNTINSSFANTKESKWLNDNCYKYGFIIRYPYSKEEITGYIYEPWHIRYVGTELATELYNNGNWITIEEYYNLTSMYSN